MSTSRQARPNSASCRVWLTSLDLPAELLNPCRQLLSEDELERAERYKSVEVAAWFVAARATLRLLLARELGCEPAEIELVYATHGKPKVVGAEHLEFNLSHSRGWAVVALGGDQPVGIDLEQVRTLDNPQGLAKTVMTPAELHAWKQLPAEASGELLLRLWTVKEACLKADGAGLSIGMSGVAATKCAPTRWQVTLPNGATYHAGELDLAGMIASEQYLATVASGLRVEPGVELLNVGALLADGGQ